MILYNQSKAAVLPLKIQNYSSFLGRFRGLMFRKSLGAFEGILMVQPRSNQVDAAIHMFFMEFDICVIWADTELKVVDLQLARRWRPYYAPRKAAKYVIETHVDRLKDFEIGDQIMIEHDETNS